MKPTIALLLITAFVVTQAQVNTEVNIGSFMGFPPSSFFQNVVLQSDAQKLLTKPDLPEDLQQRVVNSMRNAEMGFENCNTSTTLPWMQIRCITLQLAKSKNELKAIDDEAKARVKASSGSNLSNAADVTMEAGTA